MLRRLLRRVYLDRGRGRLWLDGSWYPVYLYRDGYVCQDLSVEQLLSVMVEDLLEGLLLKLRVPLGLGYTGAVLYLDRRRIRVYVDWFYWSYAVGREEFTDRLEYVLKNLGYDVELSQGGVRATLACSGKLSSYLEGLVEGLEGFTSWVSEPHTNRVHQARKILEKISHVDGRYLAARRDVSGIARMLVASLTRDDIAYILLGTDAVNSHVKPIVLKEMELDEGDVYERLRVLGLYRRAGEDLRVSWPFPVISMLTNNLYSSWGGGGVAVNQYLNAHHLMAYIYRNLYPLVVRDSRYGRDKRWRHGLKKFLEERLYPRLTFVDVAVTASMCLGIQTPLHRLRESLGTLKGLGILSENLKPRPYAIQTTRLVKGYTVKTGLVKKPRELKEWENILGWRTLTNLDQSKNIL